MEDAFGGNVERILTVADTGPLKQFVARQVCQRLLERLDIVGTEVGCAVLPALGERNDQPSPPYSENEHRCVRVEIATESATGTKRGNILESSHFGAIRPPVGHLARRPLGEACTWRYGQEASSEPQIASVSSVLGRR